MFKRFLSHTLCALTFTSASLAQSDLQIEKMTKGKEIESASSEAEVTLRRMHDYLRNSSKLQFQTSFRVSSETRGPSLRGTAQFFIQRPNSFRVEVSSNGRSTLYVSDGDILTIYRPDEGKFAQLPARDSIVGTMYLATSLLTIQARMIDFFWTIDYMTIGNSEVRVTPAGTGKIGSRECDRFTVERFEDTWDVWLEKGKIPVPCKLVSKRTDGTSLNSQVNEFKWMDNPAFAPETFKFSPPAGSKEVEISDLK